MTLTRRTGQRLALALAALGAGVIHLALGPEHMSEWAVLGWGFYAAGSLQVLWGLALVRRERVLAVGAVATLALVAVWLVSRTSGLPLGPEAWEAEPAGRADLLCVALEAGVAAGALLLLRRPAAGAVPLRLAGRAVVGLTAAAVLASTGVAVAAPGHEHAHTHACAPAPVASGVDADSDGADDGVQDWFRCQLEHSHDHPG